MDRRSVTGLVAPRLRNDVFDGRGNATSTVAVNGQVVGLWDLKEDRHGITIRFAEIDAFSATDRAAVDDEAQLIDEMRGKEVKTVRCERPPPLREAPLNRFLAPLRGCAPK